MVKGDSGRNRGCLTKLLKNLDRKRPQVMVDVKLVEVIRQKIKDLGFGWEVGGR